VIPGRDRVVLLRNGSGGPEAAESPEVCVVREVLEELRLKVYVGTLPGARAYEPMPGRRALVLSKGCFAGKVGRAAYGAERVALGSSGVDALGEFDLPAGYARAVRAWARTARTDRSRF